uniref:Uncharacterized protein n=1 Tax=Oryza meridionalis TaxID=40149 RepID=A0A0E0D2R7_9ORYZ
MLHESGIAPKLTRDQGIDDRRRRPELEKMTPISLLDSPIDELGVVRFGRNDDENPTAVIVVRSRAFVGTVAFPLNRCIEWDEIR